MKIYQTPADQLWADAEPVAQYAGDVGELDHAVAVGVTTIRAIAQPVAEDTRDVGEFDDAVAVGVAQAAADSTSWKHTMSGARP